MTTLAELLSERKEKITRISAATSEIAEEAIIEEGENINDLAQKLLDDVAQTLNEWQDITLQIQRGNNASKIKFEGQEYLLSEAIILRDRLKYEQSTYSGIVRTLGYSNRRRTSKDDVKLVSLLSAKDVQKKADAAAQRLRLLDIEIQKINWTSEV